jgi:hypothetical protein
LSNDSVGVFDLVGAAALKFFGSVAAGVTAHRRPTGARCRQRSPARPGLEEDTFKFRRSSGEWATSSEQCRFPRADTTRRDTWIIRKSVQSCVAVLAVTM